MNIMNIGRVISAVTRFVITAVTRGLNDTGRQLALAQEGVTEFWANYNSGACGEIYDEASDYFRRMVTPDRWLRECHGLQTRLGKCQEFKAAQSNEYPVGHVGIIWIRGTAMFESGEASVRLDWDIANTRPMLSNVQVEQADNVISIPGFSG